MVSEGRKKDNIIEGIKEEKSRSKYSICRFLKIFDSIHRTKMNKF